MNSTNLWTDEQIAQFKLIDENRQLFEGNHSAVFILPNGERRRYEYITVNWLGDLVSQTWKRFLFRKEPRIIVENKELKTFIKNLEFPIVCMPASLRVSYAGSAVIKTCYSNLSKKVINRLWGAKLGEYTTFDYFENDASVPYAVTFWYKKILKDNNNLEEVMVRERHELLFDTDYNIVGTEMHSTAHKIANFSPQMEEVLWGSLWNNTNTAPKQYARFEGLTVLPFTRIDNADKYGDSVGYSDYTPTLKSIQKNVNKVVAVRQLVIDLSEQPQLIIPPEYINEDGSVDWNRVHLRVKLDGEEGGEIRIVGWTGNLENSDKQWVFYRDEFRSLTALAPILFGITDSVSRSGVAKRLSLVATESEITARRQYWEAGLKNLLNVSCAINNYFGDKKVPIDESISIRWADAIPSETAEYTSMMIQQYQSGLRTLESAVEEVNRDFSISDEWLANEINQLKTKEEQLSNIVDPFGGSKQVPFPKITPNVNPETK